MMSEPRRSPLARFFGVVARRESWLNLLYLALAFPLGLFYFIFLIVGLSVGISLAIIWIGIFILGLTAACSWAFAAFERSLADGLIGTHLTPSPQPWKRADGVWPRIKAHFGSSATWKDLAFLFLKFPLGLLSFCVVVTLGATSLALATAPFYYRYISSTDTHGVIHHGFNFGVWYVDRLGQALLLVPVGLLLAVVSLHAFNGLAAMWRAVARGLLPPGVRLQPGAAPPTAGSAQPTMPATPQPYQAAPPFAPRQDAPSQPTPSPEGSSPQPGTAWPQWPGYPAYPPNAAYPANAGYPPNAAYPAAPAGAGTPQAPGADPGGQPTYGWPPYYPQPPYPQQPYPPQPYPPQAGQPPAPQAGDSPAPQAGAPWPGAQWPGAPWPQWSPLFGAPQAAPGGPAAAPVATPTEPPPAAPTEPVASTEPATSTEPAASTEPPEPDAAAQIDRSTGQTATEPTADDHRASQDEQTASQEDQQ